MIDQLHRGGFCVAIRCREDVSGAEQRPRAGLQEALNRRGILKTRPCQSKSSLPGLATRIQCFVSLHKLHEVAAVQ